jgi:dehydrogenase/reductase SDR family protein 12
MNRHWPSDLIDAALELAVVPSFSRVGPLVRGRLFDWASMPRRSLAGRLAVVTGPTSGIGRAAAFGLADHGARLVLVGRSPEKLDSLKSELRDRFGQTRFVSVTADMSSIASVQAAVREIGATTDRVDLLIDNAGAIYPARSDGEDGIEKTLATMVGGPFVMVGGLMPLLRNADGARVIAVTSGGMYTQAVDLEDVEWRTRLYDGTRAYAQAKRIQVALMREWTRRFAESGISFNAMHPGWADTPGLAASLPGFRRVMRPLLRTAEEGADTIIWLATTPDLPPPGGRLYLDRRPRPFDRVPQTRLSLDDRVELWDLMCGLTGTRPV